jgi:glycosyltransferase involved in cell wall biosynthesis
VDDCSTDNSTGLFKYLLDTDPRIRIFSHLKNMGVWRTRLDGFLYSKGKYILFFDTGDLYEDNYVLEDLYNLMEKYDLDSAKMLFRLIFHYNNSKPNIIRFHVYNNSKIVYGTKNIIKMNNLIFKWRNIWNRITRASIYTKAIYLLNDRVLNIYKNLWEDRWQNELINKVSHSFVIVERIGYLYYKGSKGYGDLKLKSVRGRDQTIQEFINFLIFDYFFSKSKAKIITKLKVFNNHKNNIKLSDFKSNFYILNDLLILLINDHSISHKDKLFLNRLLIDSKKREINARK